MKELFEILFVGFFCFFIFLLMNIAFPLFDNISIHIIITILFAFLAITFYYLFKKMPLKKIDKEELHIDKKKIKSILDSINQEYKELDTISKELDTANKTIKREDIMTIKEFTLKKIYSRLLYIELEKINVRVVEFVNEYLKEYLNRMRKDFTKIKKINKPDIIKIIILCNQYDESIISMIQSKVLDNKSYAAICIPVIFIPESEKMIITGLDYYKERYRIMYNKHKKMIIESIR